MGAGFHGGFGKSRGSSISSMKQNDVLMVKGTSPNNNIKTLSTDYKYNSESGKFGTKGKNAQIISSHDPVKDSKNFFDKISKGGSKTKLSNGKGDRVDFTDGTTITYRVITSTKGSPAVDIKVISRTKGGISTQKIHFVKED